MALKLYNTLTRRKEEFRPLDPENVRMYVCGPTVYDFAHIGNARPVIVFDVLFRLLRHLYGADHVTYVRNITDVDDKINARAAEEYPDLPLNQAIRKVTETTERQFHEDVKALGCLEPTHEPRATEHIDDMKEMIERLVAKGCAYVAEDHVLFHVAARPDYGALSRRSLDELVAGARVEVAPYKRDPMDFVLWKPSKPGEPAWPSPCGIVTPGRPGWHIECSAMARAYLGDTFDIHGGGIDLVFPHHENELAQTCCALGVERMAQVWMHNGFLQVEGRKMAKSEGNFVTIRELLEDWPGDVLRLQMLMTHYRQPIDWTFERNSSARDELFGWALLLEGLDFESDLQPHPEIVNALSDDLNTPNAVTVLRRLADSAERGTLDDRRSLAASCRLVGFRTLDRPGLFARGVLGVDVGSERLLRHHEDVIRLRAAVANELVGMKTEIVSKIESDDLNVHIGRDGSVTLRGHDHKLTQTIERLLQDRKEARQRRDFSEADRIRAELEVMGVQLRDSKDPETGELVTTWEIKR